MRYCIALLALFFSLAASAQDNSLRPIQVLTDGAVIPATQVRVLANAIQPTNHLYLSYAPPGVEIVVLDNLRRAGTNSIVLHAPTGGDVDGAATYTIDSNGGAVTILSKGNGVYISESFISTAASSLISFSEIQNISTDVILGRDSPGSGSIEELQIGSGLLLSGGVLSSVGDGGGNVFTTGPNTQYAIPSFGTGDTNIVNTGLLTDASGTNLFVSGNVSITRQLQLASEVLTPPDGFNFPDTNVIVTSNGKYASINRSALDYDFVAAYTNYVSSTGSDANSGLSPAAPKQTIEASISAGITAGASSIRVIVEAGAYTNGMGGITVTVPLAVECPTGDAYIYRQSRGTDFVNYFGGCYTNYGSTDFVVDFANYVSAAGPELLDPAGSITNCVNTPGTFIVDSGVTYIHLSDSRVPDEKVGTGGDSSGTQQLVLSENNLVLRNLICFSRDGAVRWRNVTDDPDQFFSAYNCSFSSPSTSGTQDVVNSGFDSGTAILELVNVFHGLNDGINYRDSATGSYIDGKAYEINCNASLNGDSQTDNGTTIHDGHWIIRINGRYVNNYSRSVHDIGNGGSWNVCVTSGNSLSTEVDENIAFASGLSGSADTTIMGIYDCNVIGDNLVDIQGWGDASIYIWRTPTLALSIIENDDSNIYVSPRSYNAFEPINLITEGIGTVNYLAKFSSNSPFIQDSSVYVDDDLVGINKTNLLFTFETSTTRPSGTRETFARLSTGENIPSAVYLGNLTATDGIVFPFLGGYSDTASGAAAIFGGLIASTNDTGASPVVIFDALRTTSTTDPLNATLSAITTRPAFRWRSLGVSYGTILANGNWGIGTDATPDYQFSVGSSSQFGVSISGSDAVLSSAGDLTFALSGDLLANVDTDLTTILGRARIDSRASDFAYLSHYDQTGVNSFAVRQSASGATVLNAASGQSLTLRVNNTGEALVVASNSSIGINTTGPDRKLDVLDASNPQLRLTHTDATHYSEFQTDGGGDLTVTPSGGDFNVTGRLGVTVPGVGLTNIATGLVGNYWPGTGLTAATNGTQITFNGTGGTVTGVAATASEVIGVSGSDITGVDQGAARLVGWDNSLNALAPFAVDSSLSLDDGTRSLGVAVDGITFGLMQNIATDSLIGRDTAGTGDPENITLGTGLSMSGGVLNATGGTVTGVDASVSQILGVSGANIIADDQGAPRLYGWGEAGNAAAPFTVNSPLYIDDGTFDIGLDPGAGLSIVGTELVAAWQAGTVTTIGSGLDLTGGTLSATGGGGGYDTIEEEGTPLAQESVINFIGSTLTAAAGTGETTVTSDADVDALASNSSNGLWARTGAGTGSARTITAGDGISVSNGDGVSGNPTITNTGLNNDTSFINKSVTIGSATAFLSGTLAAGQVGSILIEWGAKISGGGQLGAATGQTLIAIDDGIVYTPDTRMTRVGDIPDPVIFTVTGTGGGGFTVEVQVDSTSGMATTGSFRYKVVNFGDTSVTSL